MLFYTRNNYLYWKGIVYLACLLIISYVFFRHWHPYLYSHCSTWADQKLYYTAAKAWAHLVPTANNQVYPPGYPLLSAFFYPLFPTDPFVIPDYISLIISVLLVGALSAKIFTNMPNPQLWGLIAATITWGLNARGIFSWVTPWTTSLSTPLMLGIFYLISKLEQKLTNRYYLIAWGIILGSLEMALLITRPADAIFPMLPVLAYIIYLLSQSSKYLASFIPAALVIGVGVGVGVGAHLVIFGKHNASYFAQSNFDTMRLAPQWIIIILGRGLDYPQQQGLAQAFIWFLPGVCGVLYFLIKNNSNYLARIIGISIIIHILMYLSFIDLNPRGLWRYNNYHYFKWLEPLLMVYFIAFFYDTIKYRRNSYAFSLAVASTLILSSFKIIWIPQKDNPAFVTMNNRIAIKHMDFHDILLVHITQQYKQLDNSRPQYKNTNHEVLNNLLYNWTDNIRFPDHMAIQLRQNHPLSGGEIIFNERNLFKRDEVIKHYRYKIEFGLPDQQWFSILKRSALASFERSKMREMYQS